MPIAHAARRLVLPLFAVGVILLVASVYLAGRDVTFARTEAESEVLGLAETSALAIRFAPPDQVDAYLRGLLKHPAISMATVYAAAGERKTVRRPSLSASSFSTLMPSLNAPVVGCRAVGPSSVCLEADMGYYGRRADALLVPHLVVLAGSALLLLGAVVVGRGSNRKSLLALTGIVRGAAEESNYALRAPEDKSDVGVLAAEVNRLLEQMHQRDLMLRRRTTELETVNRELEAFSYSVSHDLRSPLSAVDGFTQALRDMYSDTLDETGREYLGWIESGVEQMKNLIAGLLQMSRVTRSELNRQRVSLSEIAESIAAALRLRAPQRTVVFAIEPNVIADADERLLHAVLENLMSNAYKFTSKNADATITVGSTAEGGRLTYFVRDNGAGFDSTQAARMFTAFQRLHSSSEFEGTGIGLATVKRIIERHGGAIWADGQVGQGATFYFTLGDSAAPAQRAEAEELSSV